LELIGGDQDGLIEHQMTVFAHGETIAELEQVEQAVRRVFADLQCKAVPEVAAAEWMWRARLPGFDAPVRPRELLAQNIAGMTPFADEARGDLRSDWGEGPIRLFKTASGSAYAFQFHVSDAAEALGHTVAFAPSSGGKTTLFSHLIGGALRHRNLAAYAFDRFNGMEVFTHAVGGLHIDLADATRLKLNPLQCKDNRENREFLRRWLQQVAGVDDDHSEMAAKRAVDAAFKARAKDRSLNSIYDSAFDTGSALRAGMARWIGDSGGAVWFNGATDGLDLEGARLVTFEMSLAMQDPRVGAALVSYLMHRIRSVCRAEARPHLVFIDETAPMLQDEIFKKSVQVLFREHRKLRGSINVVFQDVGALRASGIAETVFNNCPTKFIFPNPDARAEDYAVLELTPAQWAYVKGTSRLARSLKRSVLVKRGQESVILDVDLDPLGPWLKVYRSGSEPQGIMRELRAKYGVDRWLDYYLDLA
jgi:type IV secretion system protein VirB4